MHRLLLAGLTLWLGAGLALELEEIRELEPPPAFVALFGAVEAFAEAPDGSFYVAGLARQGSATANDKGNALSPIPSPTVYDIVLAHVSRSGEIRSQHFFGGDRDDRVSLVHLGPDGDVFLFGTTTSTDFPAPGTSGNAFALRVDPATGEIERYWRSAAATQHISPSADGGFVLAGETESLSFPTTIPGIPPYGEFGIIESTDAGASWALSNEGLLGRSVFQVFFHPADPQQALAIGSNGTSRSDDGGRTWRRAAAPGFRSLAGHPTDPNVIYSAGRGSVWKSSDGGETWRNVSGSWPGSHPLFPTAVAVDPTRPSIVFATFARDVHRSDNAGVDWETAHTFDSLVQHLAVAAAELPRLYAALSSGEILTSVDGVSWEPLPFVKHLDSLAVDPNEPQRLVAGSGDGVHVSTDGGQTWATYSAGLPPRGFIPQVEFDPHNPARLWALAQHRVYRSDDLGMTWTMVDSPPMLDLNSFALDPKTPDRLLMTNLSSATPNIFVGRLTANLELVYSRVLGGVGEDRLGAASIDELGRASLAGHTDSPDFLADAAIGPTRESDAFLLRLSPDGVLIDFATRLGGKGDETVSAMEETVSGDWLLAGETKSTDFPAVSGAQTVLAGESDGFVARLSPDGRELLASTLIGGAWSERVEHMATMDDGRIAIAGRTESSNFPVTEYGGGCTRADSLRGLGFLATLDADLTRIEGATRLGDSSDQGFVTGLRTTGQDVLVEVTNGSRQRIADRDVVTKPPHELRFRADGTEAAVVGACVFNAASQIAGPAIPGGILTINGRGIGPQEFAVAEPHDATLPFELAGVRVWFDDEPAALVHVQAYQVSVVAPASISGKGSVGVVVERDGVRGAPFRIEVHEAHPGFFTQSLDGYSGALFNEDWSTNHWETPAPDRSVVAGFITGGGPLAPAVDPDAFAGFGDLSRLALPVTATIDGLPAEVEFAGQAPGKSNAIQQVNIRIPPEVRARTTSRSFGLVLDVGGVKTQSVQIWIE